MPPTPSPNAIPAPSILRRARQTLTTDRLLGLDFVPVSNVLYQFTAPPSPAAVSAASLSRSGPLQRSAPATSARPSPIPPSPMPTDSPPITRDARTADQRAADLATLEAEVTDWITANWPRDGWRSVVFGEGAPDAALMFVGEGPGADEDAQGRPFVGRAGQLLDKQIDAMGLARAQVYIANIAKTRPPGNRVPTPEEADRWLPWLVRQVQIIQPTVIVALGATSAKYLLADPRLAITRERGTWRSFRGIDLMPTFHPAYLLRAYTVDNRRRVWDDLKKTLERLGLPLPTK